MKMNKFFSKNAFLWLLVLMVLLGKLIPYRESYNAYFNLGTFIDWGIVIIFLLYGLQKLETTPTSAAGYLCAFPAFGHCLLSAGKRHYFLPAMVFHILPRLPALYRIIVSSDGLYR